MKSRRRRVKRIITDIEVPVDRHVGRYLETHVVRPDYEMCFYIGLMDLHEMVVKIEAITDYYNEQVAEDIRKVMENTYYAYWQ